jgi:hypothetical protein
MIPPLAAKLTPRLASSFDNEVVATVRALQKALAGLDLHDVARMANSAPLSRDLDLPESEYARRVRVRLKEILAEGGLDGWPTSFTESILERRSLDDLSERQALCVNKILRRAQARRPRD